MNSEEEICRWLEGITVDVNLDIQRFAREAQLIEPAVVLVKIYRERDSELKRKALAAIRARGEELSEPKGGGGLIYSSTGSTLGPVFAEPSKLTYIYLTRPIEERADIVLGQPPTVSSGAAAKLRFRSPPSSVRKSMLKYPKVSIRDVFRRKLR
jgi:hypothetical protein